MDWTFDKIRSKVCTYTGQIGADVDDHINHIYQEVLPVEFKPQSLLVKDGWWHVFAEGEDSVDVDPNVTLDLYPPPYLATIAGTGYIKELGFHRNFGLFFQKYPEPDGGGTYTKGQPEDILFYANMMFPRPVPDDAYIILMVALNKPDALVAGGDIPLENIWGPLIAVMSAQEIFLDSGQGEEATKLDNVRKYYKNQIEARETFWNKETRIVPRF